MVNNNRHVVFIGAGSIGTALGNIISESGNGQVLLHSIETTVVESINTNRVNSKYFPSFRLHEELKATSDNKILSQAEVIFLAIPSHALVGYLEGIQGYIKPTTILVNLAKGFGEGSTTIVQCLVEKFSNPICTLKGPSFAKEIINRTPTGLTLGCTDPESKQSISALFKSTNVYLDHTNDLVGVELLSILKNIYAILLGIVDAQYDSPNLRFLILTKAFNEMKEVLLIHGGQEETLFRYCGCGDFTMTSLNDLSRNRTLGLLIGKGFFTEHVSHELVLEGKVATNVFYEEISKNRNVEQDFPIIAELYKVLNQKYDISGFVDKVLGF